MTCTLDKVVLKELSRGAKNQQWTLIHSNWLQAGRFIVRCADSNIGMPYLSAQSGNTSSGYDLVGDKKPDAEKRPVWTFDKDSQSGKYKLHCAVGPDSSMSSTFAGNTNGDAVQFTSTSDNAALWTFVEV